MGRRQHLWIGLLIIGCLAGAIVATWRPSEPDRGRAAIPGLMTAPTTHPHRTHRSVTPTMTPMVWPTPGPTRVDISPLASATDASEDWITAGPRAAAIFTTCVALKSKARGVRHSLSKLSV